VGVTAGASTPDRLVEALVQRLRELGATDVQAVETRAEDVFFAPPPMPRRV
jgi:4-hydroxy-3-methylbut-2-enyl diphosphate reductase